ncbi:PREDICTED: glucose-fructose oxidoreductase domain-containing protein 1-like isoform X2 [Priapulus caudatus]|nr:PREDICTED: glucose-fructose oxidoreductase domain-containing protein 1-like isoform X2 [Priapulus caudatus]
MCPPQLHGQIAVKALGIGKHVLCDRPAGLCQSSVLKMVNAAQYYPSLISVMSHGLRFLPAFMQARRLVEQHYIGELNVCETRIHCGPLIDNQFDWMCDEHMGGGVLGILGSHVVDILYYLTGQKAMLLNGMVKTYNKQSRRISGIRSITSDDFCTFQMELDRGASATVTLNNHIPGQFFQEILICGTRGRLTLRGSDLYGQKLSQNKEELLYRDIDDLARSTSSLEVTGTHLPKPYLRGLFKLITALKGAFAAIEDKHSWVKEPVAMAATFEDGLYTQAVLDAVKESSKKKEWVKVQVITEPPNPHPHLSPPGRRTGTMSYVY